MNVSKSVSAFGICIAVVVGATIVCQKNSSLYAAPPNGEQVLFEVTTPLGGDIEIVGVFVIVDGTWVLDPDANPEGRAGRNNVVVNRPSPAVRLDFLAELDECFTATVDDNYSLDSVGTLEIFQNKRGAGIRIFFAARGKDGNLINYRLDSDTVEIFPHDGGSFPKGDNLGYDVMVSGLRVSVDRGKRKNGCVGNFPDAMALIRLERKEADLD